MAIDRKKIIEQMSRIRVESDQNGIIEAYNVMIVQLPVTFWNSFAERLTASASEELLEAKEYLLVNAAKECGYHTGYGIINSDEWKAVVEPMIEETPADILHGAFAVCAAWGWADSEIVELVPDERMVVRAYRYYEADIVRYGVSRKMSAYMIAGVSSAFMALAYGGDYDPRGGSLETFQCEQTKGIECGDQYGEFVVSRR